MCYIQITSRCNMSCPHCGFSCNRKGQDMTLETLRAALRLVEERGEVIAIGGGEPTLHPLFWEFLGLAIITESESETVWLATNGSNTKIALRLANLAKKGIISCALSQDEWHDPISPEVVKAFTREGTHGTFGDRDFREIRQARANSLINAGRAKRNGIGTFNECICGGPFITPDGVIHPCGCAKGLKISFGTVLHPQFDIHWQSDFCAKDKNRWEEMNQ